MSTVPTEATPSVICSLPNPPAICTAKATRVSPFLVEASSRIYRIDPALVAGLNRIFLLADARPDLLRHEPARPVT
ncbi:hypothetical protein ACW4TU_45455 (plasmid) [Streptomyces sp. QTS52]